MFTYNARSYHNNKRWLAQICVWGMRLDLDCKAYACNCMQRVNIYIYICIRSYAYHIHVCVRLFLKYIRVNTRIKRKNAPSTARKYRSRAQCIFIFYVVQAYYRARAPYLNTFCMIVAVRPVPSDSQYSFSIFFFFLTLFYCCFFLRNLITNTQTNVTNRMSTEQNVYQWKGVLKKKFQFPSKDNKNIYVPKNAHLFPYIPQ